MNGFDEGKEQAGTRMAFSVAFTSGMSEANLTFESTENLDTNEI